MSWKVYIVECSDGSLYTGITTDVERRIGEHNGAPTGARYTRAKRPVTLRYTQDADDRSHASKLEMAIKKLDRKKKIALIKSASNASRLTS